MVNIVIAEWKAKTKKTLQNRKNLLINSPTNRMVRYCKFYLCAKNEPVIIFIGRLSGSKLSAKEDVREDSYSSWKNNENKGKRFRT